MNDALVTHSRRMTFTLYTHEGVSAAWNCDLIIAFSRPANNRNGCVQIKWRSHGQELTSKMKDTLVMHSRLRPFSTYTHEGVRAAWELEFFITPSRVANSRNGGLQLKRRFCDQELTATTTSIIVAHSHSMDA